MKNIIYGLADTRNDLVYYVGKTTTNIKRPLSHLTKSHSEDVNNWIKSVRDNWGDIKNFQRDEIRRAGMMFFAPDVPKLQSGWKAAKAKHSNDVSVITHTWLIKRLQQSYIKTTARAFWWTTP